MSELIVRLGDRRVGRLILKGNGNMQFRYDPGYEGPAVSQALPVQSGAHPHAVCHAVFGGLLVEGDARAVLARNLGIAPGNDYALLRELGGDCAGALTLLADEEDPPVAPRTMPLDEERFDALLHELPRRPLGADAEAGVRLSLAGAQPKLPIILDEEGMALPLNYLAATTHIVKPEPPRFPGLVDNEAFCMALARAIELPAASVSKRRSISGLPYLLVERYDRDPTTDPIRRLHQEDFCQALGRPSERKYQSEGGPSVVDIVKLLRLCSAVPARDQTILWRALVLNWLIGNCDAHAKNFSLLYDKRDPTLAPLYDLVSTAVYPELTHRLAMSIGPARRIDEVDAAAWEALAGAAGLSRRFAAATTPPTVERVLAEAERLVGLPEHDNATARAIVEGIGRRV
ncbi:MAG TPA: type II toxin-antitoxin system HipA family toxin [Solirubrobacteraceae bacterium]|nr:type II toxin-antitoxin system HipA family toxin [Solirubrobacteraceae bacterium]